MVSGVSRPYLGELLLKLNQRLPRRGLTGPQILRMVLCLLSLGWRHYQWRYSWRPAARIVRIVPSDAIVWQTIACDATLSRSICRGGSQPIGRAAAAKEWSPALVY